MKYQSYDYLGRILYDTHPFVAKYTFIFIQLIYDYINGSKYLYFLMGNPIFDNKSQTYHDYHTFLFLKTKQHLYLKKQFLLTQDVEKARIDNAFSIYKRTVFMVEKNALSYPIKRYNGPIKAKLDSFLIYRYLQPIISRNLLQSQILSQLDINQTIDLMQLRCKTVLCLIPRKLTNRLKITSHIIENTCFMVFQSTH